MKKPTLSSSSTTKKAVKLALPQRSALITARVVSAAVVTSSAMTIVVDLRVAEVATRTGAALEGEDTEEVRVLNLLVLCLSDLGAVNYYFYNFIINLFMYVFSLDILKSRGGTVHVFVSNRHGTGISVRCMRPHDEYRQFTPNP